MSVSQQFGDKIDKLPTDESTPLTSNDSSTLVSLFAPIEKTGLLTAVPQNIKIVGVAGILFLTINSLFRKKIQVYTKTETYTTVAIMGAVLLISMGLKPYL